MTTQQLSFDLNPVTALGPDAIDDGDAGRQQRGMAIAALTPVVKNKLGYKVPSQSGRGSYVVNLDGEPFCTCPDFEKHQQPRNSDTLTLKALTHLLKGICRTLTDAVRLGLIKP